MKIWYPRLSAFDKKYRKILMKKILIIPGLFALSHCSYEGDFYQLFDKINSWGNTGMHGAMAVCKVTLAGFAIVVPAYTAYRMFVKKDMSLDQAMARLALITKFAVGMRDDFDRYDGKSRYRNF